MNFSYMGTKKAIAPRVAEIANKSKKGVFLDLFCGIGSVGQVIGTKRPLWANDAQKFAFTVAQSVFTSTTSLCVCVKSRDMLDLFEENKASLSVELGKLVEKERTVINTGDINSIVYFYDALSTVSNCQDLESERTLKSKNPNLFPFNLFTICYPGTYLGLLQCVEVDSLRYAIFALRASGNISEEDQNWLLLALCKAISNCSTTTGHFAQFLTINNNNIKYFVGKRKKSILTEMGLAVSCCIPAGDLNWRLKNKVFNHDALSLLDILIGAGEAPAVIYADPPYTDDQYSRYYHLYETVIKYDYPKVEFKAKYRCDRFRSTFSLKSAAESEIDKLVMKCSELHSDLLLSYPQNGLLGNSLDSIPKIIQKYYDKSEILQIIPHTHSSFGAANSKSKNEIMEVIFRGYNTKQR